MSTRRALLLGVPGVALAARAGATTGVVDGSVDGNVDGSAVLRARIADIAVAQVRAMSPAWHEEQRDCAGFIRFAYRAALKELRPARLATPLFQGEGGRAVDFADAATLVAHSLRPIGGSTGRDARARRALRTADVLAYRHDRHDDPSVDGAVWHLMLAVVPSSGDARVVYHPGERGAAVRHGLLRDLERDAPLAWRPTSDNPSFVGFFSFAELT